MKKLSQKPNKKRILIIATGSVAVEKTNALRLLLIRKYDVKCLVTPYVAKHFRLVKLLNPLKMNLDLSNNVDHIDIVKWADLIVVVPASANTLSKFVHGIADNPALTTLLASRCPIIFAPAMNSFMYEAIIQRNIIDKIIKLGHILIGPVKGMLREQEVGIGRMVESEEIAGAIDSFFKPKKTTLLVAYGSTKVWLDPVRYLMNASSGTMGKAIVNAARLKGFKVIAVDVSNHSNRSFLESIKKMKFDWFISPAAFSDLDYLKQDNKISKNELLKNQEWKLNIDVISEVKKHFPKVRIIGFKLDDDKAKALKKQEQLGLSILVWNRLSALNNSHIEGEILVKGSKSIPFGKITKRELAQKITDLLEG